MAVLTIRRSSDIPPIEVMVVSMGAGRKHGFGYDIP
jgi:hypothetical protein